MTTEFLRIPIERIPMLLGKEGNVRKKIEKLGECEIIVDSESGEIEINGKNALGVRRAQITCKAVGRGFNPEKAMFLFDEDYLLEVIDIKEFIGKSDKAIRVKKARLIGRQGTIREKIEEHTDCFISIYGKTVAIIGKIDDVGTALKAVEMILEGAKMVTVQNFLNKNVSIKKFNVS